MTLERYLPYLNIKHDWHGINCWSIIEKIYLEQLGITLFDWAGTFQVSKNDALNTKGFYSISNHIINEVEKWVKINLLEIKEFDIILFKSKLNPNRIRHFGMYVGGNKYIHLVENQHSCFAELNQDIRDTIYAIVRHNTLV